MDNVQKVNYCISSASLSGADILKQQLASKAICFHVNVSYPYRATSTFVGFEVLAAVVMKSSIFWDIMPCVDFQRIIRRYIPEDRTLQQVHLWCCISYRISPNIKRCFSTAS
jgi:hypothetical protein